ncbi:MAG: hypothetical protein WC880_00575 [Candidatus Paceibacterota bacterium]
MAEVGKEKARNIQLGGVFYQFLVGPNGIFRRARIGGNLKENDEAGWRSAEAELARLGNRGNI